MTCHATGQTTMHTDQRVYLELPWPQSLNLMYMPNRKTGGRLLSDKARVYVEWVCVIAKLARAVGAFKRHERVWVSFQVYMPDYRRRDLDNLLKLLCDSITKAKVWHDDSQIDDLRITRSLSTYPGGKILLRAGIILADGEAVDYTDGKPAG